MNLMGILQQAFEMNGNTDIIEESVPKINEPEHTFTESP